MLIEREKEIKTLQQAYHSEYSEFVAVYGRRRIGKTSLVREAFNYQFAFQHTGVYKKRKESHLYRWDSLAWYPSFWFSVSTRIFLDQSRMDRIGLRASLLSAHSTNQASHGHSRICEMKFSKGEYTITKDYAMSLNNKVERFIESTKNKKTILLTMITTNGVVHNEYWNQIQCDITADELFNA